MYKVEDTVQHEIRDLLLKSPTDKPIHYANWPVGDDEKDIDLSIVIKGRYENGFGHLITLWVDQVQVLPDREVGTKIIRYYSPYEIQLIDGKPNFANHVIIFGPKSIDASIIKAMKNFVRSKGVESPPDPLILKKVDLKANMDAIMDHYPNLQHFCVKGIPDDKTRDIIVKGKELEQSDEYEKFIKDVDTSGNVNFLGITIERGRILYVGSDGSVFSRMAFKGEEKIRVVYTLYSQFKKIKAFLKTLDE